jgi:diguanylate cyclase (GGDEF)-like protein/PAS domain S-box-containing protein
MLDTPPEQRFDQLTELAAMLIGAPIALISLVDRDRQWFKSRLGFPATETRREIAFSAHAILVDGPGPFVIEDTLLDMRFFDNPMVSAHPNIRFYAGQPLRDEHGLPIGTLCVIDRRPRVLDEAQYRALRYIATLIEQEMRGRDDNDLVTALAEVEEQKRLILDTVTEGLVLQDSSGQIIQWNPAAEQLLGINGPQLSGPQSNDAPWSATRIDGTPWSGETHPAMVVLRTGQPVLGEIMGVQQPGGGHLWLRVNAQPIIDQRGECHQVVTTFADVTNEIDESHHRRILEEALRRSEETARVSLDALEQGVVLADRSGAIVRINPAAEAILGYTATELSELWKSRKWETYAEDGTPIPFKNRPMVRAAKTGEPVVGEVLSWRRNDGERIVVRVSVIPNVDDADGMLIGFTDVTGEHLANKLLDTTLDVAPVGLAVLNADRSILRCNQTFATQAGRSPNELIGIDVLDLVDPQDRSTATMVGRQIQSGEVSFAELDQRVQRPDGAELWVTSRLAVIPDPDRPLTIAATFDITQSRLMMAQLARFSHLFHHANDIITVIDAAGQVLYTSPSNERILGYPEGFRHVEGILSIVHADDRQTAVAQIDELINGRRLPKPFTVRVNTFDGSIRYVECVGVNLLEEPAVRGIVITARDVTERVELSEQLAHRALHDTLTDLPNRRLLEATIEQGLARSARSDMTIGLCFIDLDGFKHVNDTLGHGAGDRLLISIADRIRDSIREDDLAARVGGDEFVILLGHITDATQALIVATRIRDNLVRHNFTDEASCGASVGVAVGEHGDTVSTLLNRADSAMSRAKAIGNSSVELATINVSA